jgi:transcriptional regulator
MYVPAHFAAPDDALDQLLAAPGAVDLVSSTADGLTATTLPMLHDPVAGTLTGHLARTNPQWRDTVGDVLVIVRGPDAYVSPSWYASKAEHGRVVPTWNYTTAHVYGELVVHDDEAWVDENVRLLTERQERGREHAWSVEDAPAPFHAGQLRAIVGVEVRISRVEAKFKMSQNQRDENIDGVVAGLAREGREAVAELVQRLRPGRAPLS